MTNSPLSQALRRQKLARQLRCDYYVWLGRRRRGHAAIPPLTIVAGAGLFLRWAGSLLLGSKICDVLHPCIGRPRESVEFLGPDPWQGSFYETVFEAARAVWFGHAPLDP